MSEEKKKYKNLSTYVVCMILTVVIIIIFAAMADNRESHFETQLNEKEQLNSSIQNQIVSLSEENYQLQKENETSSQTIKNQEKEIFFLSLVNDIWVLLSQNQKEEEKEKAEQLKDYDMNESQTKLYQHILHAIQ